MYIHNVYYTYVYKHTQIYILYWWRGRILIVCDLESDYIISAQCRRVLTVDKCESTVLILIVSKYAGLLPHHKCPAECSFSLQNIGYFLLYFQNDIMYSTYFPTNTIFNFYATLYLVPLSRALIMKLLFT